ncbi:MAG: hypothetical protein QF755_01960 [Candidatus Peribacteraceae bacterium]|jgi:hypothetical protein|nr:hypothetical protein [Candidatus Peribacteraceae bacterium]
MSSCTQCGQEFEITDDDLKYYDKISVPPPTHCPGCRQQRRYAIRNERNLYKRSCDLCGKESLSMYSEEKPFPNYCPDCWWSDKWHGSNAAMDIDLNRSFFEQFRELQEKVPRIGLYLVNSENCDYCNCIGDCKRCYLSFGTVYSEDCLYGSAYYSKDCVDNLVTRECELCYECTDSRKLYSCIECQDCYNSDHLLYCYDLQGCSDCIACAGLRNKKFHIENKPVSEEEYKEFKNKINYCDRNWMNDLEKKTENVKLNTIRHYMPSSNTQNATGSHIYNSKNTFSSFFVDRCEDCSYSMQVVDLKDCYDNNYTEENELCCDYLGMYGTKRTHFSTFSRHTFEVYCSEYCINGKYLFGCSNLRDKDYCILNKQYSEEEFNSLVPKIIEGMKERGEWGEFFPIALSPFAYNETVAQEYFPMEKADVLSKGWDWKDDIGQIPNVEKIIPADQLPENIDEIPDDILNWAVKCAVSDRPFRIIKQELDFYRRIKLPIPKLHPDERHKARLNKRNPRKLWARTCDKCEKEIQTTYSPERPEKVFCEDCYLQEVY